MLVCAGIHGTSRANLATRVTTFFGSIIITHVSFASACNICALGNFVGNFGTLKAVTARVQFQQCSGDFSAFVNLSLLSDNYSTIVKQLLFAARPTPPVSFQQYVPLTSPYALRDLSAYRFSHNSVILTHITYYSYISFLFEFR